MEFQLSDVLTVAKRDRNPVRPYLYVNPLQGKHIPADPERSLRLFSVLAEAIERRYPDERLLVIGFAETATAIGSAIAWYARNVDFYLSTTRESIPGAGYLQFTESHSHATEQRLITDGLAEALARVDRIVFAEDEVTTGNTIARCIGELRAAFPSLAARFGILSILNSMTEERLRALEDSGIVCDFLFRLGREDRAACLDKFAYLPPSPPHGAGCPVQPKRVFCGAAWNGRVVAAKGEFREKMLRYLASAIGALPLRASDRRILILGTEEFMFPAMYLGKLLREMNPDFTVRFHATTRSPILASADSGYPLRNRSTLESVYAPGRTTYIYNLERYDAVVIATDARNVNRDGLQSLANALWHYGNDNLVFLEWGS